MVSQSVSKSWCRDPSGAHDQLCITVWQLRSCFCGAPSLMRGWVCRLYMLLAFASAVFLGSESLGTSDHIFLSHFWDFPFRCLLQLAELWWRYSTPPSPGILNSLPYKHSAQTPQKAPIIVDMFRVPLLRNRLHNTVVLLLLGANDTENAASSIVA
jgi:hypothetical protein